MQLDVGSPHRDAHVALTLLDVGDDDFQLHQGMALTHALRLVFPA